MNSYHWFVVGFDAALALFCILMIIDIERMRRIERKHLRRPGGYCTHGSDPADDNYRCRLCGKNP